MIVDMPEPHHKALCLLFWIKKAGHLVNLGFRRCRPGQSLEPDTSPLTE